MRLAASASLASMGGLTEIPFVAFDTETTGLDVSDRLVELAAVRFRGEGIEGEWSALVDPQRPIPPEATRVHGIQDSDVRGRPLAAEVLPAFLDFIHGAALVAHNAPFDVRVLALELLAAGLALPDNPVLDTCAIPRTLGLAVPDHRLGTLAGVFRVPRRRAHRALEDAWVAKDLFRAYLAELGPSADRLIRTGLTQDGVRLSLRDFASEPVPETPLVALVRRARAEGRPLRVVYACDAGDPRTLRLLPTDLYSAGGGSYLEGYADDSRRCTLQVDRITAVRLD